MSIAAPNDMQAAVKLYSDLPARNPEFICKVGSAAHIFWPLVLLAASAGILISGIRGILPFPIAVLSSAGCALVACAGLVAWRSQGSHRKWLLCVASQEILVHIGEKPSGNSSPVIIGIPVSQLEWVRECSEERVVKSYAPDTSASFTEYWEYLELKPRFDAAMLTSIIASRQRFYGLTMDQKTVTVKNGLIRILWLSPFLRVKPDIARTVERLRTYLPVALAKRYPRSTELR